MRSRRSISVLLPGLILLILAGLAHSAGAETIALDRIAHIHDIAIDHSDPSRLYLATHSGMFLSAPDGTATRVGAVTHDLMSFVPDPGNSDRFYASGHPESGGNLGILMSDDRGASWQRLSGGASGPVDFHAMAVSGADPGRLYGMYGGLQVSSDGGRTWRKAGPLPERTFSLAASARDADTVYAAAIGGLHVSSDRGRSWRPAFPQPRPATLVHVTAKGQIFAFIYGVGLVVGEEPGTGWEVRSRDFGDRYPLKLAVAPTDPDRIHVVADTGALVTSKDGGRSWVSYLGHDRETPELVAAAGRTYEEYCQACHGKKGVGERPEDMHGQDQYGFVAPPLDNSSHGWHHSDTQLAGTILNGSPRNPRMLPFKDIMPEEQARNVVAYIKSLWNFRSLACQGARHMRCMH
ncbi:MAG: c-type cytochrome [Rhodospirillales bacterium]|nr:MAG: c-type cytochrome [Rhodospirillales bacterium]